jgi:hypothetical protein
MQTPLWATTVLIVLCCLYTYVKEEEIDKQLPPKKDAILASLKNLTTVKAMLFEIPSELDQV